MKLLAILADTFREALARKTIIGFFVISNFFLVIALIAFIAAKDSILSQKIQTPGVAAAITMTIPDIINGIEVVIARLMYAPAMLLSIFATASIVPNALEKGSIDLLLSKPISRTEILVGKFLGGSLMVFLNIAYYIIGMWFIVSLTTGYWNAGFRNPHGNPKNQDQRKKCHDLKRHFNLYRHQYPTKYQRTRRCFKSRNCANRIQFQAYHPKRRSRSSRRCHLRFLS